MDRKQKQELELEMNKVKHLSSLYSSSSSSSSWITGAADRPPGSCLRDVLPSIVSPKESAGCGGCPPLDAGPFPRKLVFPVLNHLGETFLLFEPRLVVVGKVNGSLKRPPLGEGLGCWAVELCRSVGPAVDVGWPSPPT